MGLNKYEKHLIKRFKHGVITTIATVFLIGSYARSAEENYSYQEISDVIVQCVGNGDGLNNEQLESLYSALGINVEADTITSREVSLEFSGNTLDSLLRSCIDD